MTVEDTYAPKRTAGNGVTTAFSFNANVEDSSEIVVNLILTATNVATLQVDPTDYTITLNTVAEGGTVNFVSAPLSTQEVLIERLVDYDQNNNIPDVGDIRESKIEGADDKLTRLAQQLREISDRTPKLTVEGSTKFPAFVHDLPDPVSNAILAFNNVPDGYRAVTLAALSAIALPINSGIAVFQGGNTFDSVKLSNIGNATWTNDNGVAGNPTIDTSLTDNAVSNMQLSIANQGANLIGYDNTISSHSGNTVKLVLDELSNKPKAISLTRAAATASGSQTVAHGFTGKLPSKIDCVANNPSGLQTSSNGSCHTDGTTFVQACQSDDDSGVGGQNIQKDFIAQIMTASEVNGQRLAVSAVNASSVTFDFTKVGTPAAGTYEFELSLS